MRVQYEIVHEETDEPIAVGIPTEEAAVSIAEEIDAEGYRTRVQEQKS